MEAAFFFGGMDAWLCVPTRLSIRNSPLVIRHSPLATQS